MVYRDPETKEWREEISPPIQNCNYDKFFGQMYLNAFERSDTDYSVALAFKCYHKEEQETSLVFLETNNLKDFHDYTNYKAKDVDSFNYVSDKETGRWFFAFGIKESSEQFVVELIEYLPGAEFRRLGMSPFYKSKKQSLGIYRKNNLPHLVHLSYTDCIGNSESASLTSYIINKQWVSEEYPLPFLGTATKDPIFVGQKGSLLMGIKNTENRASTILVSWFNSDQANFTIYLNNFIYINNYKLY